MKLSHTKAQVLGAVAAHDGDPRSVRDVADDLRCGTSRARHALNTLERDALVAGSYYPVKGQVVRHFTVTEKGRAALKEAFAEDPECSSCGAPCQFSEGWWVCTDEQCGSEWNTDHDPVKYAGAWSGTKEQQ